MIEATVLYNCGKLFGYTPQQIRELTTEEYAMLMWSADEDTKRQNEAQSGKGPKHNAKGGSSVDGEKVSSVSQLMAMANKGAK